MTAVLSLLAGMVLGALVCALLVLVIAFVWRRHFRTALLYFGLAEDTRELVAGEAAESEARLSVRGKALSPTGTFDWPHTPGHPEGQA